MVEVRTAVIRKKEDRPEAFGHSRSKTRNQRWIDFLRSTRSSIDKITLADGGGVSVTVSE